MIVPSPTQRLSEKIAQIESGGVDGIVLPVPSLDSYLAERKIIRIESVARFWSKSNDDEEMSFEQLIEDFVVALYGLKVSLGYLIIGEHSKNRIFLILPNVTPKSGDMFMGLISGTFPEVSLQELLYPKDFGDHFAKLSFCGAITGIPMDKSGVDGGKGVEQIERLIRGLQGDRWAYMVMAEPVERAGVNNIFDSVAEEIRNVHDTLLVKGTLDEENRLAKYYVELLEADLERCKVCRSIGMWRTGTYLLASEQETMIKGLALSRSIFSGDGSTPQSVRIHYCQPGLGKVNNDDFLHTTLSSKELATVVRLPKMETSGYSTTEYARFDIALPENLSDLPTQKSISLGTVVDNGLTTSNWFTVPLSDLTKHGLVVGTTGSGKTNTCMYILAQLWKEHQIPFLVIEPAKSEYRNLAGMDGFDELLIFTLGDETTSPFRLNPFEFSENIHIQTHIDHIKSLFNASFVLYAPMPYVLEQSIHEIYEDRGWDLAANQNRRGYSSHAFPTLTDLYAKVTEVVDRLGYDKRVSMDVKAGLRARIQNLQIGGKGLMLDTRRSVSIAQILSKPTVLELKQIGDEEEKAFLIGLLLVYLYEYHEVQMKLGNVSPIAKLKHVTLVEEAHRLLKKVSTESAGEGSANPRGKAVEAFSNILAELRAYGEGILVAEQIPLKLAPDVIKNTNLKVMHRLTALDDRVTVGETMNLDDRQRRYITTLSAGRAVIYAEGADRPYLVQIPNYKEYSLKKEMKSESEVNSLMLANFHRRFPEVYYSFDGCSHCKSHAKNPTDVVIARSVMHDSRFQEGFSKLCLAMLEQPTGITQGYSSLRREIRRIVNAKSAEEENRLVYCAMLSAVDWFLDTRGKQYSWRYVDLSTMESLMHDIVIKLVLAHRDANDKTVDSSLNQLLRQFQDGYRNLCCRPEGVFTICSLCKSICLYRYDITQLLKDPALISRFSKVLSGDGVGNTLDRMNRFCVYVVKRLVIVNSADLIHKLGLCYAAQMGSWIGLSKPLQLQLGKKILADRATSAV